MMTLLIAYFLFNALFAVIGAMRGWGKEILVSFSVILGIAIIVVFEEIFPPTRNIFQDGSEAQFWFRAIVLGICIFFGYQSPKLTPLAKAAQRRDQIQDFILGLFFGLINGYLIVGSFWYYMHEAGYPFKPYITSPELDPVTGETALRLIPWFAPALLTGYRVIIALILAFVFIMIVFI
jgi:hypothetical protein